MLQLDMHSAHWRRIRPLHAARLATTAALRWRVGPLHAAAAARLRPLRLLNLLWLSSAASRGRAWLPLLRGLLLGGRRLRLGLRFGFFARRWLIFISPSRIGIGRISSGRVSSGRSPRRRLAGGLPWRRADALGIGDGVSILQRRLLVALDQLGRDALRHAWHAFGEHRLTIARKLFLAVEKVAGEPIRRVNRISNAGTAAQRQDQRRRDKNDAHQTGHCMAP